MKFSSFVVGVVVMEIVKQWIAGIKTRTHGLPLSQHLFVPDKPGCVEKADDVLADDLPDDEREDGHDTAKGKSNKDHAVDGQIQDI